VSFNHVNTVRTTSCDAPRRPPH